MTTYACCSEDGSTCLLSMKTAAHACCYEDDNTCLLSMKTDMQSAVYETMKSAVHDTCLCYEDGNNAVALKMAAHAPSCYEDDNTCLLSMRLKQMLIAMKWQHMLVAMRLHACCYEDGNKYL